MSIGKATHTTKWIPVKNLSVRWANAQRPFNKKWAEEIRDNLDPDMFGVLAVTKANGKDIHHVIDGQHRKWAIEELWGGKEQVPCNIFDVDSPDRAAELFNAMNTARKQPFPLDVFKVRVTAKIEPEFSVNKAAESLGFKIANNPEPGYLRACGACVAVYKRYGHDVFVDSLLMLRRCWDKNPDAGNAVLIRGFAEFLHQHGGHIDRVKLADKVSKNYTPGRLIGAARTAREMFRGSVSGNVARVLVSTYNQGLRQGKIDE